MPALSETTDWEIAFAEYLAGEKQASQHTLANYTADVRQLGRYLAELDSGVAWEDVDRDILRGWVAQMMDDGYSATTVNAKLCSVRAFYRFLTRSGRIAANKVQRVQGPKRGKPLPAFVREDEMNRLLDIMQRDTGTFEGARDRLVVLMFYLTGMRRAELLGLDTSDVDLDTCQLKVTGKRRKQRIIPFGNELKEAICGYLALREARDICDTRAFFINNKGARLTESQAGSIVHNALAMVTTSPKKSPHVLRHTFATTMLNGGAGLESVKELLGHASVATTEIYTHTTFEQLRQVYKNAHPRAYNGTDAENKKEEV